MNTVVSYMDMYWYVVPDISTEGHMYCMAYKGSYSVYSHYYAILGLIGYEFGSRRDLGGQM